MIRAHNITPGMADAKDARTNTEMVRSAIRLLQGWDRVLSALVISPERALEELNSDWTALQELADVLMRKYRLPFRVGHHFASNLVDFAKIKNLGPLDFPYEEARRIYREVVKGESPIAELPMSEWEFRATLNPLDIVKNRATSGGLQPSEMKRMLALSRQRIADYNEWVRSCRVRIDMALAKLDADFAKLLVD